ncbi:nuclear pore complex protein Nup50 [Venturia canescens]|uniref:nuclear pore complex protein Nup50 n=1 Tax=Venturia canescens TaxID=32260 RepID=UPI001C9D08F6|nr:nuclear pore complex protein Nup50 [Venturia canescens]XP_043287252.1 nuclear pore complex protein Nup50 [Venturia canescens]XP_043287253.1 nuclear pore complex protein Nup50 [Venturia canescens]XP_043287254.1 nuclear pore complex protein Nup50 [Venturia canescens]XP_043287255.1 nuclear pore complex protein Nup50 [Venturia canescens]XP_043287256.1 nuclear pore complex protein Nup50 [Venturia canescens]
MACKRTATSDLNHDNWDNEDEPEEAGTFVKAPPEVLEKRVVKAARRRLPRSADGATPGSTKTPFGLFSGFKTAPAPSSTPFSFLSKSNTLENSTTSENTLTQSNVSTASNGARKIPENGTDKSEITQSVIEKSESLKEDSKKPESSEKEDRIFKKSSDYFAKLKGLNEGVTQWIKSHVDSNPFCILTPIFRDYEKYLKDIEAKHAHESFLSNDDEIVPEKPLATSSKLSTVAALEKTASSESLSEEKKSSFFDGVKTSTSSNASFNWGSQKPSFGDMNSTTKSTFTSGTDKKDDKPTFGSISTENNLFFNKTSNLSQISEETDQSKTEKSSGFGSFGQSTTATATFSFGQSSTTGSTPSAGFSFGSGKPFSFGSHVVASQNTETKADEDKEEDEEPPKPDFKPITEEDAFFEKRCKVFVKKDGNFGDRGVGVLFLKPTPNGKTQLIVRADNSLGNLLLNTLLTTSIPTKRMNKNTVMLVCLPLPDSEPPPTPVLLRVKTSEDADNLIETLDNNKK